MKVRKPRQAEANFYPSFPIKEMQESQEEERLVLFDSNQNKKQCSGRCRQNGSHIRLRMSGGGKPRTWYSRIQGQMACTVLAERGSNANYII